MDKPDKQCFLSYTRVETINEPRDLPLPFEAHHNCNSILQL